MQVEKPGDKTFDETITLLSANAAQVLFYFFVADLPHSNKPEEHSVHILAQAFEAGDAPTPFAELIKHVVSESPEEDRVAYWEFVFIAPGHKITEQSQISAMSHKMETSISEGRYDGFMIFDREGKQTILIAGDFEPNTRRN